MEENKYLYENEATIESDEMIAEPVAGPADDLFAEPDPEAAAEIAAMFFRVYPHEELAALYAQTSVSELKHRDMERALRMAEGGLEEGENELYPSQTPVPYVPAFIRREKVDLPVPVLTEGEKKGTALYQ